MILEITDDHIAQLSDVDLRTLVGYLCEREVIASGHSASAVTWGGHQNAPDGGIDVRVSLTSEAQISGFVPRPATGYQIKAQDMPESAILKEMAPDGDVLPSIADLAANGGAYIIVSSKGSLSNTALTKRRSAMALAVERLPNAGSLVVDFYDRRRLATWVNQHRGLVPWVRMKIGQSLSGWHPFEDWSSSPVPLDQPYLLDDGIRLKNVSLSRSDGLSAADGIAALREILSKPKGVVRLVGLSGVGKTRLIQALFDERIGKNALPHSDALYTDISESPAPVPLDMLSRLIHLAQRVVMIVDNCPADLHRKLANKITGSQCSMSLITVEYDINDDEPERTDVFKLEPASVGLVEKILELRYSNIAAPSRRVIANFSDGNARVAFALAETATNGESLATLGEGELFRRLFNQQQTPDDDLFDAAKACALLYSFDGETLEGEESELVPLAKLAGQTVDQLYKHVATLYRRQLVQKRNKWRAILPHALAHRLAKRALAEIPFQRIDDAIIKGTSRRMLRSFARRMGCLHDDESAIKFAANWLSQDKLLADLGNLDKLSEGILENIAPANPVAMLEYFEQSANNNGNAFFGEWNQNRKVIVRLARSLAYDPELFTGSAKLLVRFALAETKKNSDSAFDTLKSLFYLYLSGTHATAEQRLALIKTLCVTARLDEMELGAVLLKVMLQTSHFTSHYSFEFGAWKRDYGFQPRLWTEIHDWYARTLDLAREIGLCGNAISSTVRKSVASHIPSLLRTGMGDEVIAIIKAFAGNAGWPEGWIGVRSAIRRYSDQIPAPLRDRLDELEKSLRPVDLAAMIRSYALSPEWGALDIADLEEDVEHKPTAARERIYELCNDLGRQLAQDENQFDALIAEVVASDSNKVFAVGQGVGIACSSLVECWGRIKVAFLKTPAEKRRAQALAGFLASAMTRNAEQAEGFLDEVLADSDLQPFLVYLQVCAGVNARAFHRLIAGLSQVPVAAYEQLSYGRAHEGLTDQQFRELLIRISAKERGLSVALEILGMRVFGLKTDKEPVGEVVKAIGRELIAKLEFGRDFSEIDHSVSETIQVCFDRADYEPQAHDLCVRIFEAVKSHSISSYSLAGTIRALTEVCPIAVLDVLVEGAAADDGIRRSMFQGIRGDTPCPLDAVPTAVWLSWASRRPETRFPQLAEVIRFSKGNDDDHSDGWSEAARALIGYAPDPSKVLDVLLDRFSPMGWSGSRADIMATRVPLIEELTKSEKPQVAAWAEENGPKFVELVAKERKFEAARDRKSHESFE